MLCLSRKKSQGISLTLADGQRVLIAVSEVAGGRTVIGVQAPQSIRILRSELDGQWPLGLANESPTNPGGRNDAK